MTLTEAAIINTISDVQSLDLFKAIAQTSADSDILTKKSRLTRKQYYSRMSELTSAGLVRRMNGKYFVTSFGKVVYKAQELIAMAAQYSSKLKAIDSVESPNFPAAELTKIIDTLISNSEIKEILVSRHRNNNIPAEKEVADNKEIIVSALTKCSSLQFNPSI